MKRDINSEDQRFCESLNSIFNLVRKSSRLIDQSFKQQSQVNFGTNDGGPELTPLARALGSNVLKCDTLVKQIVEYMALDSSNFVEEELLKVRTVSEQWKRCVDQTVSFLIYLILFKILIFMI